MENHKMQEMCYLEKNLGMEIEGVNSNVPDFFKCIIWKI